MPDTFSAKQVATRIGTDPKTLRKFLRSAASPYEAVGQGARYEFPKEDLGEIKRAFVKWQKGKPPPTPPAVKDKKAAAVINGEIEIRLDDFDGEPTQEEMDEIEAHFPDEDIKW